MASKPWHQAALEQFCRSLPLRAAAAEGKPSEERREFTERQVATLKKLLEALLVEP